MKRQINLTTSLTNAAFFLLLLLNISACHFQRAVKKTAKNEVKKAKTLFQKASNHKVYGTGAKFYLERFKVQDYRQFERIASLDPTLAWLSSDTILCVLEQATGQLSHRSILKLSRYDAARSDIRTYRNKLQDDIAERMYRHGTIQELQALEANANCWSDGKVDSIRTFVPNKLVNPNQAVFGEDIDNLWEGTNVQLPNETQIQGEKGRSCLAMIAGSPYRISYDDATTIINDYEEVIRPENYRTLWQIQKNIWDIFQTHNSYCDMSHLKENYPNTPIVSDCWYEVSQDVFCEGNLKNLLAFHRNNPHTALNVEICNQILCRATMDGLGDDLSPAEQQQLADIRSMQVLNDQLFGCPDQLDETDLIAKVVALTKQYQHHKAVYNLAVGTLEYFAKKGAFEQATIALKQFRPLFPDSTVCTPSFYFQNRKQAFFDFYEKLLERAAEEPVMPTSMDAWNTETHDEYAMISWGETNEVFFMRRDPTDGTVAVVTSNLKEGKWSKPEVVKELSVAADLVPLSISSEGRLMLLKSEGQLLRAQRSRIGHRWTKPEPISAIPRFAGDAWISPDDSLMLWSYYSVAPNAGELPLINLAVSTLTPDGSYDNMRTLGPSVNRIDATESKPVMALGGRLLFYVSDRKDGIGMEDMFSIDLKKPNDWLSMDTSKNMGLPLSTIWEDFGISHFSEYTGHAYFHRLDPCSESLDIWYIKPSPESLPDDILRLAGVVLDENGKTVTGGYMEFTPNFQLDIHKQLISPTGTYNYTVKDSTEVVRLFPVVPGYYTKQGVVHHLATTKAGEIIRDTFRLESFDYIRRNLKLTQATFFNKTAIFDRPDRIYPQVVDLAKKARRMGAEIVLIGHTDNSGSADDNQQLSLDRAQAVKDFLVEKVGFPKEKISVQGMGAKKPICSNATEAGRRCNRRVEVVFNMPDLNER
ncbi:MAG: OmpA family protein [Bacteroidota bacterium]